MGTNTKHAMGWLPDYPDLRDYTEQTQDVKALLEPTGLLPASGAAKRPKPRPLPSAVDLREWCSAVEDQLSLGSCTAQAGAGILEYYERKAFGRNVESSRLFLYKVTRNLMKMKGDCGAYLRMTMGAMILFGTPPEEYWPYTDGEGFDREPPAFCYAFAENYKTIKYYRHDPPGTPTDKILNEVKKYLAAGHPVMFGFTVHNSIDEAAADGRIPFPSPREKILGGHAVAAVGYDDRLRIKNGQGGPTSNGALLIRNSWGESWGEKGYGWLPYDYVRRGLAEDFWSVLKKEWVDTGQFTL